MSGSNILLTTTKELGMILRNISRRVVGNVVIHISPSNIFPTLHLTGRFNQNFQAAFGS